MIQLVRVELGLRYQANSRRHLKPFRGVEAARSAVVADNRFVFAAVATFTFTANNVIVNNKLQRAFNTRQWSYAAVAQQWGGQGGHWAKSRGPLSAGVPEFQAKK